MTERYAVPEKARRYAASAVYDAFGKEFEKGESIYYQPQIQVALKAFIRWQSENPPRPTPEVTAEFLSGVWKGVPGLALRDFAEYWIPSMYLTPKPSFPEEIKDLLYAGGVASLTDILAGVPRGELDRVILEAYRRGQESK